MKPTMLISSVKSELSLPKRNLEVIANCSGSNPAVPGSESKMPGYENVSWRFLNALGVGKVHITLLSKRDHQIMERKIPVSAGFLAVCTKVRSGSYKFEFAISLS